MEVVSYLEKREGNAFPLHEVVVRLEGQSEVSALVPLYNGKNVIEGKTTKELATMALAASGTDGTCLSYVKGIAERLTALGINDPAVSDLWKAINNLA
jgi:cation transport regulator ChaC